MKCGLWKGKFQNRWQCKAYKDFKWAYTEDFMLPIWYEGSWQMADVRNSSNEKST